MERSLQPETFDTWLTRLPDDELLRISGIADQAFAEKVEDEAGIAQLITTAMRFSGQHENRRDSNGLQQFLYTARSRVPGMAATTP